MITDIIDSSNRPIVFIFPFFRSFDYFIVIYDAAQLYAYMYILIELKIIAFVQGHPILGKMEFK